MRAACGEQGSRVGEEGVEAARDVDEPSRRRAYEGVEELPIEPLARRIDDDRVGAANECRRGARRTGDDLDARPRAFAERGDAESEPAKGLGSELVLVERR